MKRLLPTLTLLCFATLLAPGCSDSSPGPDGDASRADGGVDGPRDDVLRPDGPQPDTQPDATPSGCGIQTFASGKQPQNEIHVAQNGSDQNGDGSATKPYASIGEAVKHATPGSAIRVHSGTYSGGVSISGLAGTAAAPTKRLGLADIRSPLTAPLPEAEAPTYASTTAEVIFGRTALPTPMIQRDDLPVGAVIAGPAIVSEPTATTVVPPGATLRVDPFGSLVIAVGKEG